MIKNQQTWSWFATLGMGVVFAAIGFIAGSHHATSRSGSMGAAVTQTPPATPAPVLKDCPPVPPPAASPVRDAVVPPTQSLRAEASARVAASSSTAPHPVAPPTVGPPRSLLSGFRINGVGPSGGVQLGRIARGALPDLLGLHSGDEILTVNGFAIANPEQAMRAYAKLPFADRLTAVVARGGERVEITYLMR